MRNPSDLSQCPDVDAKVLRLFPRKIMKKSLQKYNLKATREAVDHIRFGIGVLIMQLTMDTICAAVENGDSAITDGHVNRAMELMKSRYPTIFEGNWQNEGPKTPLFTEQDESISPSRSRMSRDTPDSSNRRASRYSRRTPNSGSYNEYSTSPSSGISSRSDAYSPDQYARGPSMATEDLPETPPVRVTKRRSRVMKSNHSGSNSNSSGSRNRTRRVAKNHLNRFNNQ